MAYSGLSLTVLQLGERGKEGAPTSGVQIGFVFGAALGAGIGGVWLAALSDGATANRAALVTQSTMMIGVMLVAMLAVRQLPAWPQGASRTATTGDGAPGPDR